MENKKKIVLVDSNNIAYRAFYALPQTITTSNGTMTNAVFGFTSMILKLIEEQKPDIIICAFDSKGPTFRHELFEEYKATRKKMPDELIAQIPLIKEVLESLNITTLAMEGFEADDIIATITGIFSADSEEIIIVSGDKDILQLVSDNVKVMAIKKGISDTVLYDEAGVVEKFGVKPGKIKELLALMGDSSDNIPGIAGIGPKTALGLVKQFGTVDSIYENTGEVKNEKLKKLLIENESNAKKSWTLVELNSELPIDIKAVLEKCEGFDMAKAESVFSLLEFNALKKRLKSAIQSNTAMGKVSLSASCNDADKPSIQQRDLLNGKTGSGLSVENKAAKQKKILSIGFPGKNIILKDKKIYLALSQTGFLILMDSLDNFYLFGSQALRDPNLARGLACILENSEIVKSGFDLKQIYKFLEKYGIDMQGKCIDFKILYLLLNADKPGISMDEMFQELADKSLVTIIKDFPGFEIQDFTGYIPGQANADDFGTRAAKANGILKDSQMAFSFEDESARVKPQADEALVSGKKMDAETERQDKNPDSTITTLMEKLVYYPQAEDSLLKNITDDGQNLLYDKIEGPLIKVLADMEFKGVNIDGQYLARLMKEYNLDIDSLTKEIYSMCGSEFNINSTQQLAEVLYKRMNLSATKKTKTGFSTDAGSLVAIYDSHPVISRILDYREKVKLKNTYIDVLPNLADPADGRVHTTYNQLGTTTGRISSNNPNLQNIPVRTELGKKIRKAFIPGKGYDFLVSADYSQIELRVLAHLSQDEDLINAFNSGQDIHTRTASEIFQVEYEAVDESLRRKAKAINFGIIYGMTEFGLKNRLAISEEEAREYIRLYFARYPKVKRYINFLIETAYKTGVATTMFGRKRYIKELASTNANFRSLGERLAVNTPIQGSAADIMKLATVELFNAIRREKLDCNIILHVHDEIVLEFRKEDTDSVKNIVIDSMENCVELVTKLKADIKIADNWYI